MPILPAPAVPIKPRPKEYAAITLAEAEARVNGAVSGLRVNEEAMVTFHSGELSRRVEGDLEAMIRSAGYHVFKTNDWWTSVWAIGSGTTPSLARAYWNK